MLLVHYLRTRLGRTGTVIGCDTSNCGACTVLLNGLSVKSCTVLAIQADGSEITTVQGVADGDQLHPVQKAFHDNHGAPVRRPHRRHDIPRGRPADRENPDPTEREVRRGPGGQPLPVHRLPQHRQGRASRRRRTARRVGRASRS